MIAANNSTVAHLQESQLKPQAEYITHTNLRAEFPSELKLACLVTPQARHKKITTSCPTHRLGPSLEVDTNIPFYIERDVSKLKRSFDKDIRNRHGRSKFVLSHESNYMIPTLIARFLPSSFASQVRYFTPSVKVIDKILSALCQNAFKLAEWLSIFCTQDDRQAAVTTVASNSIIPVSKAVLLSY